MAVIPRVFKHKLVDSKLNDNMITCDEYPLKTWFDVETGIRKTGIPPNETMTSVEYRNN